MNYSAPKNFDRIPAIKIKNYATGKSYTDKFIEFFVLGQFERAGYFNLLSAKRRAISALFQTVWGTSILCLIGWIVRQHEIFNGNTESAVSFCAVVGAIFGAAYFREMKDIHNKWDYISKTFNDIVMIEPVSFVDSKGADSISKDAYSRREHLAACLAHDILTMNMWSHRSFRAFFKEIIVKAIILESGGNGGTVSAQLISIADNGLDYSRALELVSNYLDCQRPKCDRPSLNHVKLVS